MSTIVATAMARGDAATAGASLVSQMREQLGGRRPELVVALASTQQPLAELMPLLRETLGDVPLVGASTAGEFVQSCDAKASAVLFAVAGDFVVFTGLGTGLSASAERATAAAVAGMPAAVDGYPHRTAILLLDPLAGNGEEATLLVATALGGEVRLAGGAAGDDLQMKATWVGHGGAAHRDAVVVATIFSRQPLGVGVAHGHVPMSPPLRVTRADGNVVHEIEGRPAWNVWLEHTRAAAASRGVDVDQLSDEDVGGFLLRYEAGLATGADYKIRAPLARGADGSLSFACGIPQDAVVRITESVPERQIASAREAARRAREQMTNAPAGALVFDCICRNLILAGDFQRAVHSMSHELGDVPLAGFETYGEIALEVGDMSGFHNTTTVVLAFPS